MKHYHQIEKTLYKLSDIGAVVIWLLMIFEYLTTNGVYFSMSLLLIYLGVVMILFATVVYLKETSNGK